MPLLYATIFPIVGLIFSIARRRTVDAISILVVLGLAYHIVIVLLAPNIVIALVIRSLDGAFIGVVLVVSALIGRPLILYVVRQAVRSATTGNISALDQLSKSHDGHAFHTITIVWGVGLMLASGLHVALALILPPAEYLLASPILGFATIVALLVWSARHLATQVREQPADPQ